MARVGKNPKLEVRAEVVKLFLITVALLITACGGIRHLTGEDIRCLEAHDENEPSVFRIEFDSVAIANPGSLTMRGQILTSTGKTLAGASVQFGLWKTVEDGAYFIVREEFTADLDGRFAFATRIHKNEWMVVETVLGNRFFRIADGFDKNGCAK